MVASVFRSWQPGPERYLPDRSLKKYVWSLDASATALNVAGAPADDRVEGVNLMPWMLGEKSGQVHDALYWRWRSQAAVLSGNWKFVRLGNKQRYLFDMTEMEKKQLPTIKLSSILKLQLNWSANSRKGPIPGKSRGCQTMLSFPTEGSLTST
jgi:hypothetical protein